MDIRFDKTPGLFSPFHIVMLFESVLAIMILKERKKTAFKPVLILYIIMSVIAELLNTFGHFVLSDRKPEPNMFQITPYYPSTQVVFSSIAKALGIIPEIIIYSILIYLYSPFICCIWSISLLQMRCSWFLNFPFAFFFGNAGSRSQ